MTNYPDDFLDTSVKFRNISLSQNEKEMVSTTAPVAKIIVIDYFIDAVKKLSLKNPIIIAGDAPTYSTFSYTATAGDKVAPKYTRGISVIVTDWNAELKSLGDVLSAEVYTYDTNRESGEAPRKLEETTYGWVEQLNIEITFWSINSSKGRDLGGQFIKRTMLEGLKSMYFLKNGIMSVVPNSGFDSNDTSMLKTNSSVLYQHVTRWTLSAFFYINTTLYEPSELIEGVVISPNQDGNKNLYINGFEVTPSAYYSSSAGTTSYPGNAGNTYNTIEFLESGAAVIYDSNYGLENKDEDLNAYAKVTLSKTIPNTSSLTTTTSTEPAINYPGLNNYYLGLGFEDLLARDAKNTLLSGKQFATSNDPTASNIERPWYPLKVTTTSTTSTTSTTTSI